MTTLNMNTVTAGAKVIVSTRKDGGFAATFLGFTKVEKQYSLDVEFKTLKEAKAHYGVRKNADLEKAGDSLGYGHMVYAVFSDGHGENGTNTDWSGYLHDAKWVLGSSADVFGLNPPVEPRPYRDDEARAKFPRSSDPVAALDRAEKSDRTFERVECPSCGGSRVVTEWKGKDSERQRPCGYCDGSGSVSYRRAALGHDKRPVDKFDAESHPVTHALFGIHAEMDRQGFPKADELPEDVVVTDAATGEKTAMHFDPKESDREWDELTVTNHGGVNFRRADGTRGSADFSLLIIRAAWGKGLNLESEADGFGGDLGTYGDWSAIRDSTQPAIAAMLLKAVNHLELY